MDIHASHRDRVAQCGFNATLTTIRGLFATTGSRSRSKLRSCRHAAVLNDARNGEGQRHVAIDGKTLRRSFNNFLDRRAATYSAPLLPIKARVLVSSRLRRKSPMKSRRVQTCSPRLRCRCHALSKKAFEQADAASVHLIAQVKANQPALHKSLSPHCATPQHPSIAPPTADKKRRCRDEARTVEVFAPGGSLADTEWDS